MTFEFDCRGRDYGKVGAAFECGMLTADLVEKRAGGHDIQWIRVGPWRVCIVLIAVAMVVDSLVDLEVLRKSGINCSFFGDQVGKYFSQNLMRK